MRIYVYVREVFFNVEVNSKNFNYESVNCRLEQTAI